MSKQRSSYPVGYSVSIDAISRNPYPTYSRMLQVERTSWVDALNMWWVTGYNDVTSILMDSHNFVTESGRSPIRDTFGKQMLSTEGSDHARFKNGFRASFQPGEIRRVLEKKIAAHADTLIDNFASRGSVELRAAFASRLPVLVMLELFGMSLSDEPLLRSFYDSFDAALSNFVEDRHVRATGQIAVSAFHDRLQDLLDRERKRRNGLLIDQLLNLSGSTSLSDDEIKRNMSIVLFGGISTVEALMLNSLWSLATHQLVHTRLRSDLSLLPSIIEEVMRWQSPVQSATRYAAQDMTFQGHQFRKGDLVNCMLGAANRDPEVFRLPDQFDIDRTSPPRHLGFATGPHFCLGLHLARMEVRIALEKLYTRIPDIEVNLDADAAPTGYEFRKPRLLNARWGVN
jgi:cytochrome P450